MNVLRLICCEFAGSTCHVCAFKYINFIIKGLKSVYGMQKLDIRLSNASLCFWSTTVFPWIYIYWNQFENDMLTDINKAFTIATIFFKWNGFGFYNSQFLTSKKENSNKSCRRCNELQSKKNCTSFCTETLSLWLLIQYPQWFLIIKHNQHECLSYIIVLRGRVGLRFCMPPRYR